jgi:hypothetical protein
MKLRTFIFLAIIAIFVIAVLADVAAPKPKKAAKPKAAAKPKGAAKKSSPKKSSSKSPKKSGGSTRGGGGGGGWNRAKCEQVIESWLKHKIIYQQRPTTKQFVTSGKGLFRSDCSGFVSAAWNLAPPGLTTYSFINWPKFKHYNLQRCDGLVRQGHVALFWDWDKYGQAIVIEEYNWNLPATKRVWDNFKLMLDFKPIKPRGW